MKNKFFLISFLLLFFQISESKAQQATEKDPIAEKTEIVATRLGLDNARKASVYNVFLQTEKRINDLALGTENYDKLINYINQERNDMLKSALTQEQYLLYQKSFANKDRGEVNKYVSQNRSFVTKKTAEEMREKRDNEKLMAADKAKLEKEDVRKATLAKKEAEKAKVTVKKEADKAKALAKKEAEKAKVTAKKEAYKTKALSKKEAEKAKVTAKREADKTKAEDKKAKDAAKREADKMKAADKKEKERVTKELKKQEEFEKKFNKK